MGWYMVKSGLEDRFHGESDVPRVSQYRLASHLGLAFVLYTLFLWSGLDHLTPAESIKISSVTALKASRKFRMLAHTTKGMVFLTAISGKLLFYIERKSGWLQKVFLRRLRCRFRRRSGV